MLNFLKFLSPFVIILCVIYLPYSGEAKESAKSNNQKVVKSSNKTNQSTKKKNQRLSQLPPAQNRAPSFQNKQDPFYQQYQRQPQPPMLPYGKVLVSTTNSVPGYRVVEYKGIVRGDVVFGPTILQAFKSSLKAIIGGKIGGYTQMCQRARQNAFEDMLNQARQIGANAVIGVQYDSSTFSTSNDNDVGTEVFCYGTAVRIAAQ